MVSLWPQKASVSDSRYEYQKVLRKDGTIVNVKTTAPAPATTTGLQTSNPIRGSAQTDTAQNQSPENSTFFSNCY